MAYLFVTEKWRVLRKLVLFFCVFRRLYFYAESRKRKGVKIFASSFNERAYCPAEYSVVYFDSYEKIKITGN